MNLGLSGTRREELLFGDDLPAYQSLRRTIAHVSPREAMKDVLKLVRRYPSNSKLLLEMPKG